MFSSTPKDAFKGKTILVTGGTGTIGSEICKQLLDYEPAQVRIYSRDDTKQFELSQDYRKQENIRYLIGDVRDKNRLSRAAEKADFIFHVAALKHVVSCEYNPFEAVKTNVVGTENVIDVAIANEVGKVLLISTDKATNPTNTMGVTKLLAERLTVAANLHKGYAETRFSVVRFGNVYGSRGSVVPLFINQIKNKKDITITDPEMTRYFMTIEEAADFVITAMVQSIGGEIFIKKMSSVKIGDLVDSVIEAVTAKYNLNKKDIKKKIIGPKAGERDHEILFTEHESTTCYELEDRYVILPFEEQDDRDFNPYLAFPKTKKEEYSSRNGATLSKEELMKLANDYLDYEGI